MLEDEYGSFAGDTRDVAMNELVDDEITEDGDATASKAGDERCEPLDVDTFQGGGWTVLSASRGACGRPGKASWTR